MVFKANIPQPTDNLSKSQGDLLGNMQQLDASFLVDHYTFSDISGQTGKHRQVTTPVPAPPAHVTTLTEPKMYGNQDTALVGAIQYSRGPSDAVPTPITKLHAGPLVIASSTTSTVLDFTGIPRAICQLMVMDTVAFSTTCSTWVVFWNGTNFQPVSAAPGLLQAIQNNGGGGSSLEVGFSSNVLQIVAGPTVSRSNVYWTLEMWRLQ